MIVRALPRALAFTACQWSGTNVAEVVAFSSPHPCVPHPTAASPAALKLTLPIGIVLVLPSDWLVLSPRHELLVYPDDTFQAAFQQETV